MGVGGEFINCFMGAKSLEFIYFLFIPKKGPPPPVCVITADELIQMGLGSAK